MARGGNWGHDGCIQSDVPIPVISEDQVLVKVHSIAQNPTDQMHLAYISPGNAIIGCDYSGTVEKIGKGVTGWKVGDRIAGAVHGGVFTDEGSYAEYLKTDADLAWHVPEETTFEDAATFGIGAVTAIQALFVNMGFTWPDVPDGIEAQPSGVIYIHSGASSVGLFAIQLAKMKGLEVVVSCSPKNNELVKSYGADFAYDYHMPDVGEQIRRAHSGITRALDCFSDRNTLTVCTDVVDASLPGGAQVILLRDVPFAKKKKGSNTKFILSYTLFGKAFSLLRVIRFAAVPEDRAALVKFYDMLPSLIKDRGLKANPVDVRPGGLQAVEKGLAEMKAGKVSGKKLVVNL